MLIIVLKFSSISGCFNLIIGLDVKRSVWLKSKFSLNTGLTRKDTMKEFTACKEPSNCYFINTIVTHSLVRCLTSTIN